MKVSPNHILEHRRADLLAVAGIALFILLLLWKILLTNQILVGLDLFTYFYPYRDYVARSLRAGHLPIWNPYLFCGAPLLANPQSAVLYPLHWPLLWLDPPKMVALSMALHLCMAGVFAYAYARESHRLRPLAAFGGALAFAGSGFVVSQAEQINQLNVTAWLPLSLLLLEVAAGSLGRQRQRAVVLLGVTVALQFLAGHTQAFYINMVALGIAALWPGVARVIASTWLLMGRAVWRRAERVDTRTRAQGPHWQRSSASRLCIYLAATLLGLGLAGAQLLPTMELSRLSMRGGGLPYRQAVSFSLRPRLLLLTLLPSFGHEDLFGEHLGYMGILPLGLALLGALAPKLNCRNDRQRAHHHGFLVCLALVGLALALGGYNPTYWLLYKIVPGIALFRAPGRWLVLYTLGIATLVGTGIQQLISADEPTLHVLRRRLSRAGMACVVAMTIALLLSLGPVSVLTPPTAPTLLVWIVLGIATWLLLWLGLGRRLQRGRYQLILVLFLGVELLAASQKLPHNHPTAPQAYSFLQPSLSVLHTDGSLYRFVSIIHPHFDPGNMRDIQANFASQLSPRSLYDYIIAAKLKAILERNLPMRYGVSSLDGYDGGVLPLDSFLELQRLFLPEERILVDGRLRERLQRIPDGQLLSLLNVKYAITDKVTDVWSENVYYDLSHEAVLEAEQLVLPSMPREFPSTGLGIVSFLDGSEQVAEGTPVAEVTVIGSPLPGERDSEQRFHLVAGIHTGEGRYTDDGVAHSRPEVRFNWAGNQGSSYVARLTWAEPLIIQQLKIRSLLSEGRLHLRGLSLVDDRVGAFEPVIISTQGHYRLIHNGALKIYENLDVLPRAFLSQAPLSVPQLDQQMKTRIAREAGQARILSYAPEIVVVEVDTDRDGYLILTDTFYPGWNATVDGKAVPIIRVEPCFRAVRVEAGQHRVEFSYQPLSLRFGMVLSGISLLIALLVLVRGGVGKRTSIRS
jgi:hypothetical protein